MRHGKACHHLLAVCFSFTGKRQFGLERYLHGTITKVNYSFLMEVACRVVYEQQALSGERNAGLVIDYVPIEDRVRSACRLGIGGG